VNKRCLNIAKSYRRN